MATQFVIVATAIVVKNNKFLITKRSSKEKYYPGKWTVPGGKLDKEDYESIEKNSAGLHYEVLEKTIRREVKEEVNLEIKDINYVTSIVFERDGGVPTMIISLSCQYKNGEVKLDADSEDYKWVTIDEAKNYDLIDGIYDELVMCARKLF
ncbi:MAG: NUDIX domain-containing protein [Candidatus Woesearchaeota archaeon]|jgi:8-oxo-dGTP diphosphatase